MVWLGWPPALLSFFSLGIAPTLVLCCAVPCCAMLCCDVLCCAVYHYRDFTVDSERFPNDKFKAFVDK